MHLLRVQRPETPMQQGAVITSQQVTHAGCGWTSSQAPMMRFLHCKLPSHSENDLTCCRNGND